MLFSFSETKDSQDEKQHIINHIMKIKENVRKKSRQIRWPLLYFLIYFFSPYFPHFFCSVAHLWLALLYWKKSDLFRWKMKWFSCQMNSKSEHQTRKFNKAYILEWGEGVMEHACGFFFFIFLFGPHFLRQSNISKAEAGKRRIRFIIMWFLIAST